MAVTLIAHTEVGSGGAANITFSSIPSTYDDLWLVFSGRWSTASTFATGTRLEINGSTTAAYSHTLLRVTSGPTLSSSRQTSQTSWLPSSEPAATATASTFGNMSLYIPNYKNTSYNKQGMAEFAASNNSSTDFIMGMAALLWSNTAAISQLKIFEISANSLVQYSQATLYGITKA